jgi:hypothetical protein
VAQIESPITGGDKYSSGDSASAGTTGSKKQFTINELMKNKALSRLVVLAARKVKESSGQNIKI